MIELTDPIFYRNIFIDSFIDTTNPYYKSRIETVHNFLDGECYTGYLWDVMKSPSIVTYNFVTNFIQNQSGCIYVFWDIHSREQIKIDNYWKYSKNTVLQFESNEFIEIVAGLPEDCYFFDSSLSWAIAITHEEIKKGRRMCYFVSNQDML